MSNPLLPADLFMEPISFVLIWLLLGWLLLQSSRQASTIREEPPALQRRHPEQEDNENLPRGLTLGLLGLAFYVLLRYWHRR